MWLASPLLVTFASQLDLSAASKLVIARRGPIYTTRSHFAPSYIHLNTLLFSRQFIHELGALFSAGSQLE